MQVKLENDNICRLFEYIYNLAAYRPRNCRMSERYHIQVQSKEFVSSPTDRHKSSQKNLSAVLLIATNYIQEKKLI